MKATSHPVITLEGAMEVIDRCLSEAHTIGVDVVVTVTDPGGHPVAMVRMDGSPMLSIGVADAKAWTVAAFGKPTSWWEELLAADPSLSALGGASERFMPVRGGVPLVFDGALVGAVGVSGATAGQDEQIAIAGAATLEP